MPEFPSGWTTVSLDEAARWYSGGTPSTSNDSYWGGDIPWISAASLKEFDISDSSRRVTALGAANGTRVVPADTTIFVVRGMSLKTEFRIGLTSREVAFGQDCKALIPDRAFDPSFFAYALKARSAEILRMVDEAGHGTGRLPTDRLQKVVLGVPPIAEQQHIVDVLRLCDVRISRQRSLIAKAGRLRTALLNRVARESWLLGAVRISDIAEGVTSGSRGWAPFYSDSGAILVRIGNLRRGNLGLDLRSRVFVDAALSSEGTRSKLRAGDLLISITADLGIVGVVDPGLPDAYVNQHIALVRLRDEINPRWIGYMLSSYLGQRQFDALNDSGAKSGLNLPAVGALEVPVPDRRFQDNAADALNSLDCLIADYERGVAKTMCLKEGLAIDLLTGRVRASDVDRLV